MRIRALFSARTAAIALCLTLVCFIGWRSPNYYSGRTPSWDGGGYLTVAYNMHQGKVLYRDIYDYKPPLFFALQYLLSFNQEDLGVNAVRAFEKANAAVMCGLVFFIALAFLGSLPAAVFSACLFTFAHYDPDIIRGGNLSEEYGNCLYLLAVLLCSPPVIGGRARALLIPVGIVSCLAALIKEPYAVMCLPWMGYAGFLAWREKAGMAACAARLAAGVALPLLPFVAYFLSKGAMGDWVSVYTGQLLIYPVMEAGPQDRVGFLSRLLFRNNLAALLLLFAALSVIQWRRAGKLRHFPQLALAAYLVSLFASMGLSSRVFPQYLLLQIPPWSFLLAAGAERLFSSDSLVPARLAGRMRRWIAWRHFRKVLLPCLAAAALFLGATSSSWSKEVSYYAVLGIIRTEADAGYFTGAARRLAEPLKRWRRPEQTTLDALLPPGTAQAEGMMMMHQRTSLYSPMHGITAPEGTKPFFGIALGLVAMRPDYLDRCARALVEDRPAVFIGSDMYGFAMKHLASELAEFYAYLGKMPLFLDPDEDANPDYARIPLHWYVRKDLLDQVNHGLVEQLAKK